MSVYDDYILPFIGNTLGDIVGPWQTDKPTQEKMLRSGAGLAGLFTKPIASLATYSPEAQAALLPASVIESKLGRRALRAGISQEKLLQRKDLVHDGRGWNRYFYDDVETEKVLKALREDDTSTSLLRNFFKHTTNDPRVRAVGGTAFRFDPNLQHQGQFVPSGSRMASGSIDVNPNYPLRDIKNTMRHEKQHAIDDFLGRSSGASPDLYGMDSDLYTHNMGEVRARLNAAIGGIRDGEGIPGKTLNPTRYEGLKDLFYEGAPSGGKSTFKRYRLNED